MRGYHGDPTEAFARPDQAGRVIDRVNEIGLTIELLVNNAGYGIVGTVEQADAQRAMSMLRLNVGTLTELTYRIYLPLSAGTTDLGSTRVQPTAACS